ncbi:MAG: restriction endonuclease subunit S [Thiobacillus sp.]
MSKSSKTVGRVSPQGRNPTSDGSAHGDVGLRDEAANPTYGSMEGEWRETTLGNVLELKRGYDLPQQSRSEGNVPLVSSSGVTDRHSVAMVKGPGVVTGRYGTLGQVFYITEDFWPLNTALYVRDFKGNDPRFISYFLRTLDFQAYSDKGAVPGLNRNHLHQAEVKIPCDVHEQRAIAHILGTLDDKIELNRCMNETLEAIARAIFKSWFVDFDPVRAKASGEPPESICRRLGLTPDLLARFPDRLVDSELGEIPEGWEWSSVGEEVSILGGGTPSTANPEFWNGEYAWVTPKDLSGASAKVLIGSKRKITQAGVKKISSGQLPIGTVLLSSRAPIGYLSLAMIPVSINQGFIAMVCDKRLPNTYVLQWAIENLDAIKQRGSGTTFAEISKANFRPMAVLVPGEHVLKAFHQYAMPLYEQITAKVRESETLGVVRDALLPKLLSGKLESFRQAEMTEVV